MSNITITYAFDIDRKKHAEDRSTRNDIEDYNEKEISNAEILYAIDLTKRKIAEKINSGEIQDGVSFVIKSAEKELAVAMIPHMVDDKYWKLLIKTVFRESESNPHLRSILAAIFCKTKNKRGICILIVPTTFKSGFFRSDPSFSIQRYTFYLK